MSKGDHHHHREKGKALNGIGRHRPRGTEMKTRMPGGDATSGQGNGNEWTRCRRTLGSGQTILGSRRTDETFRTKEDQIGSIVLVIIVGKMVIISVIALNARNLEKGMILVAHPRGIENQKILIIMIGKNGKGILVVIVRVKA